MVKMNREPCESWVFARCVATESGLCVLTLSGVDADQEDDERADAAPGLHHPDLRAAALTVLHQVRFMGLGALSR